MKFCENELVARMDSDDISYFNRCEKQLEIFQRMKKISICSGIVEEFIENKECVKNMRVLPEKNGKIFCMLKGEIRLIIHVVVYKKSDVIDVGVYRDFIYWKIIICGFECFLMIAKDIICKKQFYG